MTAEKILAKETNSSLLTRWENKRMLFQEVGVRDLKQLLERTRVLLMAFTKKYPKPVSRQVLRWMKAGLPEANEQLARVLGVLTAGRKLPLALEKLVKRPSPAEARQMLARISRSKKVVVGDPAMVHHKMFITGLERLAAQERLSTRPKRI